MRVAAATADIEDHRSWWGTSFYYTNRNKTGFYYYSSEPSILDYGTFFELEQFGKKYRFILRTYFTVDLYGCAPQTQKTTVENL